MDDLGAPASAHQKITGVDADARAWWPPPRMPVPSPPLVDPHTAGMHVGCDDVPGRKRGAGVMKMIIVKQPTMVRPNRPARERRQSMSHPARDVNKGSAGRLPLKLD